jgi:hypothetical protein
MLGYETHGTSFSDETMAKPMSHGLRAFVPSLVLAFISGFFLFYKFG